MKNGLTRHRTGRLLSLAAAFFMSLSPTLSRGENLCFSLHQDYFSVGNKSPSAIWSATNPQAAHALQILRSGFGKLGLEAEAIPHWAYLERALTDPQTARVAIIGPTNSGKSSIFNAIANMGGVGDLSPPTSPSGASAGSTARPVMVARLIPQEPGWQQWKDPTDAQTQGPPIVRGVPQFFERLRIVDTPAYDIRNYVPSVRSALALSDLAFIVIDQTSYRSDLHTNAIKELFRKAGWKKIVLIFNSHERSPNLVDLENKVRTAARSILSEREGQTKYKTPFIGAFTFHHDGKGRPVFTSLVGSESMSMEQLLTKIDAQPSRIRKESTHIALAETLDFLATELKVRQKLNEEVAWTQTVFSEFLLQSFDSVVHQLPFRRLGQELESLWYGQSHGLRAFARWLAHPGRMLRGHPSDAVLASEGFAEVTRFLDHFGQHLVDRVRQFVTSQELMLRNTSPEKLKEFEQKLEDLQKGFLDQAADMPQITQTPTGVRVKIPNELPHFKLHTEVEWRKLTEELQQELRSNFLSLTAQFRIDLEQLAKRQSLPAKMMSNLNVTLAIVPMILAVSTMVYRGSGFLDVTNVASLFGAHLAARLFVNIDERYLSRSWTRLIEERFREKQHPLLLSTVKKHLDPPTEPKSLTREELDSIESAMEFLATHGVIQD